jgi:hypothetical protein
MKYGEGSYLKCGQKVRWNEQEWILHNYSHARNKAVISRPNKTGNIQLEPVVLTELEKANPPSRQPA